MKKIMKWLLVAIALLVILLITGKQMGWVGKADVLKVAVEKASRRSIVETVTANGKIQPEVEVKISPDVSGEIIILNVKEGDVVKEGDLLVRINPDVYISTVERMEASLNTAHSNLANSRARFIEVEAAYLRSKKLFEEAVVPASEFETVKANYLVAEQNIVAAEYNIKSTDASLKEARNMLAKTTIFAPVAGTVYGLKVERGERVVGTTQMAGTEMMRIANLNQMEVAVEVNENDIVRVHVADTADIEVDAYLNRKFTGVVTEVANSAKTEGLGADQVTNFAVKIRILQSSYKDLADTTKMNLSPFRPGMSATLDVRTHRVENIITVPIQSVTMREDSTDSDNKQIKKREVKEQEGEKNSDKMQETKNKLECVFIYENGNARLVRVKTGIQDNNYIEITEGLEDSVEVISAPYSAVSKTLKDGRAVEKVTKDGLFTKETE